MSRLGMLLPNDGQPGIIELVVKTVEEAGGNACPPLIIGLGIGGTGEKAMLMAKKALLRRVGEPNPDPEIARLEQEVLTRVNALGVGPMGYGGTVTALAVHAEVCPPISAACRWRSTSSATAPGIKRWCYEYHLTD